MKNLQEKQRNQVGFKQTSVHTSVPDNDVARLMYYFSCVCTSIEYDDDNIDRYRNYKNWSSLSYNETRVLLALCITFSPDLFDNKIFFHSDALATNFIKLVINY